ncbi:MAG: hypothetical protein HYW81_03540 [Parcubacteria group bacterium]|nr:hypothetical protein [Parcubacteria group bacterium]
MLRRCPAAPYSCAPCIARELKIPTVMGTNRATDMFKTGDRVKVDADKGVVRKL